MILSPTLLAMLSVVALLVLLAAGVPIFVSLGVVGLVGIGLLSGFSTAFGMLREVPYAANAEYLYIVIPLFVLMGHFAFYAGITNNAFDIGRKWFSKMPAGLALATICACAFMGAACGSSVAASATMGKIALPEMLKKGYNRQFAAGCVAAGGLLAIIIPPSVILVLYAVITNTSVGACLVGGFIPGIITTLVFMIGISTMLRINPSLAPPTESFTWKERFVSLKGVWGIVVLFAIVIGGMGFGVFTPVEAAAGGVVCALLMLLFKPGRKGLAGEIKESMIDTVRTSVFIFIIMICAGLYSNFLIRAGAGEAISTAITNLQIPPIFVVIAALLIYLPLGCFLDPASCLLITLPILYPIIVTHLGFNPVWFGILVTKMIEIGLLTPPVGLNVFTIAGVAPEIPVEEVFRGAGMFILFESVTIVLLLAFPVLTTWLPALIMK
jgi:tripartite ATP-independent transporter DctM subunit